MQLNGKLYQTPLDTLRKQAIEDRPAFMEALKAAGMNKVGERLRFESELLSTPIEDAGAQLYDLPRSFIDSAFPTKRDYEASLLLSPAEQVFAENAARRRANAGVPVDGVEKPAKPVHGLIHGTSPQNSCAPTGDGRSTFDFFLAARTAVDGAARGAAQPVRMTLDVRAVTSALDFFRACEDQIHISAGDLDGFADELQHVGQGVDVDRDHFRPVELDVIGFATCKPFLLCGSKRAERDVEEIFQSCPHITVTFVDH